MLPAQLCTALQRAPAQQPASLPCMDAGRLLKPGYYQLPMLGAHASALPKRLLVFGLEL